MRMKDFIRENRTEIDEAINSVHYTPQKNDHERELWIRNDEGLYNWARSSGVKI